MIVKEERYDNELAVFASRHEAGVQALYGWLLGRQVELNAQWPSATAEELTALQGEAKLVMRLRKLIETGPVVKPGLTKQL